MREMIGRRSQWPTKCVRIEPRSYGAETAWSGNGRNNLRAAARSNGRNGWNADARPNGSYGWKRTFDAARDSTQRNLSL